MEKKPVEQSLHSIIQLIFWCMHLSHVSAYRKVPSDKGGWL